MVLAVWYFVLVLKGIHCFSLSSSPSSSEDGHITVCPGTTVTLTCTASGVSSLLWRDQNGLERTFRAQSVSLTVELGPYSVSLVATDNIDPMTGQADFNSTLEMSVDDNINNGTNITCQVFGHIGSILIYKRNLPPPVNIKIRQINNTTATFLVTVSWERGGGDEVVDEYRIQTNTTNQYITTSTTTVVLEGEYNTPLEIRVWAINCAGPSPQVTEEVIVAGCGPPSPPVNGSVGEWTGSQVGAQVTYYCDTDLVLVGERVAHCSLPSLQWMPSSDDVRCISHTAVGITAQVTSATTVPNPPSQGGGSLSTVEVVATTAVVCVACSMTVGLLLGVLLTQCHVQCHRKKKRDQTQIPPVYEDIPLEKKLTTTQLKTNEAYGILSH